MRAACQTIVAALLLTGPASADTPVLTPPAATTIPTSSTAPAVVDPWQQLVAADFADREQAVNAIWAQGESARARLTREAETGPLDKRERCRRILWLLDLGVDPSLPPDVLNAIGGYDFAAPDQERYRRVQALRTTAQGGSPLLIRLGLREPDPQLRQLMFNFSYPKAIDAYVDKLVDTPAPDLNTIEAYATAFERAGPDASPRTLGLAVLRLTGRLDAEIERLRSRPLTALNTADRQKLARLLCAAGRDADAHAVAASDPRLLRALLIRSADWPALGRTLDAPGVGVADSDTPAAAAVQRLNGDAAGADRRVLGWLATQNTRQDISRRVVAGRLMLGGQPVAGVNLWATLPDGVGVLRLTGRWAEALAMTPPKDAGERAKFDAEQDRLRQDTGDRPSPPDPAAAAPPADAPEPWRTDWHAAADAYRKQDFAEAVRAADRVLARAPAEAAAWLLKATCLERAGSPDASAVRASADVRCAARWRTWMTAIERFDSVGLSDLADVEAERLLRTQPDSPESVANVGARNARRHAARGDWAAAAGAIEQVRLTHLTSSVTYVDAIGYVRQPYQGHLYHARAAWAAGDRAKTLDHLKQANAYLPADGGAAIAFVPLFLAKGDTEAANEVFDPVWAAMTDLCRKYPKAARLHNSAAWTALRSDRHLDEALKLTETAVELRPGDAASLDTLAEALFRNGRQDEAVARMREAVRRLPDDATLRERLAGFEQNKIVVPPEPE